MMEFYGAEEIHGVTCCKDHAKFNRYYVLPSDPQYRQDDDGMPVMRMIKFRKPIDSEDGKKGGAVLAFDVEFVVPEEKLEKVKAELQNRVNQKWKKMRKTGSAPPVEIAPLPVKRAAARLQFLDSGGDLVESVQIPASPSLYGNFVTSSTVTISEDGAPVAIAALKGDGGMMQYSCDLWTTVRLPVIRADVWFNAQKFYSFYQKVVKTDGGLFREIWSGLFGGKDGDTYKETIREQFIESEAGGVYIEPGDVTDQKVLTAVRDWCWDQMSYAMAQMVVDDVEPVSDDQRKVPGGLDKLERSITQRKLVNFRRSFRENTNMEWNPAPQGTLPNITTMGAKWEDHYQEVEPDDFFRELNINASVNADFERLPLDSVNVKVSYPRIQPRNQIIMNANDQKKFRAYLNRGKTAYTYSYEVNYDNGKKYRSKPVESEEDNLRINVGELGILDFMIQAGDLDFDKLRAAQVFIEYEDRKNNVRKIERQFMLDADNQEHRFQEVILKPQEKPIRYQVKYLMKDGTEFMGDWTDSWASPLVINDVWSATKTVNIRATGDLNEKIDTIHLDLRFTQNDYNQKKSVALDGGAPSATWVFPVISETGGTLTYGGTIRYFDGTTEEIPQTEALTDTIEVGPKIAKIHEIQVLPDLINWNEVNFAIIVLNYNDDANGMAESKTIVFRNGDTEPAYWSLDLKDKTKTDIEWRGTFFLFEDEDGNPRPPVKVGPEPETETFVVPQYPLIQQPQPQP